MTTSYVPRDIVTFFGVNLYRSTQPGRLRWSATGIGAADTLEGMKDLVRYHLARELSKSAKVEALALMCGVPVIDIPLSNVR